MNDEGAFTTDTLLRGRMTLFQPTRGFRTSLDPVLLAAFVTRPVGRFVDIGAGTGALSFALLAWDAAARGVAIEIQPALAALLRRGVDANRLRDRLRVIEGDVREMAADDAGGPFDLVISNPPFQPLGTGWLPDDAQKRMAHHELTLALPEWLRAARGLLRAHGRLAVIFPATREDELLHAAHEHGFVIKRRRLTRPDAGKPPTRIMIEAVWAPDAILQATESPAPSRSSAQALSESSCWPAREPDLIVHRNGAFTPEVMDMVEGGV